MGIVKRFVLFLLLFIILEHGPWRLIALFDVTLVVHPGLSQLSDRTDHYWDALNLEARLINLGWRVGYVPDLNLDGNEVYGLTNPETRIILINDKLRWNERYRVLAHEAGHALQPWYLEGGQEEAFAEAVSTLLTGDELTDHARYMARHRVESLLLLVTEWRAIYRAADFLRGE